MKKIIYIFYFPLFRIRLFPVLFFAFLSFSIIGKTDKIPVGKSLKEKELFTLHTVELQKGDTIYTLTDGYADQFGGENGKKFKYKQLEELLLANHDKPMIEQKKILDDAIEQWKGMNEQVDDILIIGIRV